MQSLVGSSYTGITSHTLVSRQPLSYKYSRKALDEAGPGPCSRKSPEVTYTMGTDGSYSTLDGLDFFTGHPMYTVPTDPDYIGTASASFGALIGVDFSRENTGFRQGDCMTTGMNSTANVATYVEVPRGKVAHMRTNYVDQTSAVVVRRDDDVLISLTSM